MRNEQQKAGLIRGVKRAEKASVKIVDMLASEGLPSGLAIGALMSAAVAVSRSTEGEITKEDVFGSLDASFVLYGGHKPDRNPNLPMSIEEIIAVSTEMLQLLHRRSLVPPDQIEVLTNLMCAVLAAWEFAVPGSFDRGAFFSQLPGVVDDKIAHIKAMKAGMH